jgi:hypothetical protein
MAMVNPPKDGFVSVTAMLWRVVALALHSRCNACRDE